jgi:hypothetical protein
MNELVQQQPMSEAVADRYRQLSQRLADLKRARTAADPENSLVNPGRA